MKKILLAAVMFVGISAGAARELRADMSTGANALDEGPGLPCDPCMVRCNCQILPPIIIH